ncbi:MAG: [protein-PII] uridylyltransferase [Candidatus Nanopelagicaceae bacterium]
MGLTERKERSLISDHFLTQLYESSGRPNGVALVAVGGFGRGELSPGSDLDLLILHDGSLSNLSEFVNSLLYPIWDRQGPKTLPKHVDHSVRTIKETKEALTDIRVVLGLLDARIICGNSEIFKNLISEIQSAWKRDRLEDLRLSMTARHQRFGDLAYLLEPDIKEARGGLRDINALRAINSSEIISINIENFNELEAKLLDIRDSLHVVSGREKDLLLFQEQDKVAADLGFVDADSLMGQVATIARSVDYQLNVAWHKYDNRRRKFSFRKEKATNVGKNIGVDNHAVVIEKLDPSVGMRAAAKASQLGLPISIDSCELIKNQELPNPWPREIREDLVAFIGGGSAMERVWEALDQAGVIEKWLPEWSSVRSLPQRNALHRHTVDRHMVETAVVAANLTRTVHRPDLLLVGSLFHDIGKGTQDDHSERGAKLIAPIAKRIGFSESDIATLQFLIRHHLLLSSTATRRDLDDPATIQSILDVVPDMQHLELLHALSIADGEATGKAAWSDWKARLVRDLVYRVKSAMKGTLVAPEMELSAKQIEQANSNKLTVSLSESAGSYSLNLVAPDSTGLFSIVAGALNLLKFDIRAAKTRTHGKSAVMTWIVNLDPFAQLPTEIEIAAAITSGLENTEQLTQRIEAKIRSYAPLPGVPVPPPEVEIIEDLGTSATIIEIRSHDRPALLFRIGAAVKKLDVDIRSVIASTLGAEAIDTLYVTEISGAKLLPEKAAQVVASIRTAID